MRLVVIANGEVEAAIKKHGAPVRQKPHGSGYTALFYQEPSDKSSTPAAKETSSDAAKEGKK